MLGSNAEGRGTTQSNHVDLTIDSGSDEESSDVALQVMGALRFWSILDQCTFAVPAVLRQPEAHAVATVCLPRQRMVLTATGAK
jgi:hypothetical protein